MDNGIQKNSDHRKEKVQKSSFVLQSLKWAVRLPFPSWLRPAKPHKEKKDYERDERKVVAQPVIAEEWG